MTNQRQNSRSQNDQSANKPDNYRVPGNGDLDVSYLERKVEISEKSIFKKIHTDNH